MAAESICNLFGLLQHLSHVDHVHEHLQQYLRIKRITFEARGRGGTASFYAFDGTSQLVTQCAGLAGAMA